MTERACYVYRLVVEYPPGSQEAGWEPEGWEPDWYKEPDTGADYMIRFGWPAVRRTLTLGAAQRRAELLRKYGATVSIERSEPVVWNEKAGSQDGGAA